MDNLNNEDRFVEVTNDDGTTQTLMITTVFKSDEYGKEYIVLEDVEEDESGEVAYYPYTFEAENEDDGKLTPVTNQEELEMIDGVVEAITDIEE